MLKNGGRRLETAPTFHSRSIRIASSRRVKRRNFEQATSYRNQILGIERFMTQRLEENKEIYNKLPELKREILIDALEDVAEVNLGFHDQIQRVIRTLRKTYDGELEREVKEYENESMQVSADLRDSKIEISEREAQNQDLEAQIQAVTKEIEDLENEIEQQKSYLYQESDLFARERDASSAIKKLQLDFEQMFEKAKKKEPSRDSDAIIEIENENRMLKKELDRKRYEVEIAAQITKRLMILTKHKFD